MADDLDEQLEVMLRLIAAAETADELISSKELADAFGVLPVELGDLITAAMQRHLVWGIRTARLPVNAYDDLEVTVQGRRFLTGRAAANSD